MKVSDGKDLSQVFAPARWSRPRSRARAWRKPRPGRAEESSIATLSVGTVLHVVASGLGKVAIENSKMNLVVTPMASARSWVGQINATGRPVGIMQMSEIWQAYTGKLAPSPEAIPGDPRKGPPYQPASPNLRILLVGTTLRAGMLVSDDSPMRTMKDIKGKRMTWGFPALPPTSNGGWANRTRPA